MEILIFTSPNSNNEQNQFWQLTDDIPEFNSIIFKGGNYHNGIEWDVKQIKKLMKEDLEYLILLHEFDDEEIKRIGAHFEGNQVVGYSTQKEELINHLWSWKGNNHLFELKKANLNLPFDMLCYAIHQSTKDSKRNELIAEAKNKIIQFFIHKKLNENNLDSSFRLLQLCETPQGASKAVEQKLIDNFDEFTKSKVYALSQKNDPYSSDYKNEHKELRDYLMVSVY